MANIMLLSLTGNVGGAEIVLEPWIKNANHKFYIITSDCYDVINYFNKLKEENKNIIEVISLKQCNPIEKKLCKVPKFLLNNVFISIKIKQLVSKYRIDIIYGNNSLDCFPTLFYKKVFNNRAVVVNHVHDMLTKKNTSGFILSKLWKKSNMILVPSIATKEKLIKLGIKKEKIKVVYNSVDIPQKELDKKTMRNKYKIDSKKKVLLFVGSFSKIKNIDLFLDIVEELSKLNKNISAIIIGKATDESYYKKIKSKVELMKSDVSIYENMQHKKIKEFYALSDIMILTSDKDSLPTVILEAMANCLPVYSRNVDGVPEIIKNNKNGFLFDYNETIPQICYKLVKILNGHNEELIKNAKETIVNDFSHQAKVENVNKILKNTLN